MSETLADLRTEENTMERSEIIVVKPEELDPSVHGEVICYPGKELGSFQSRRSQLEELRVSELIFEGQSKVGRFGILGKGCVSIVVKAKLEGVEGTVALKIRRIDANRQSMQKDFEMQKLANSFEVGPKAIRATDDLFAMEFIEGTKLGSWFFSLSSRSSKKETRALVKNVLKQCYLLDEHHIDHGELSNPAKHILLRREGQHEPVIIDFESASMERRPANLTSVAQFLFLNGWRGEKMMKILLSGRVAPCEIESARQRLFALLKSYKHSPSKELLESILECAHCS
jgi:putative serine/threonine protein kinase